MSVSGTADADDTLAQLIVVGVDAADLGGGTTLREVFDVDLELARTVSPGTGGFDTAACQAELGDLVAALEEINGRLDVGLIFTDYSERLGDASVADNRIRFAQLEPGCISEVGVVVEQGLNRYLKAQNRWDACIEDLYCVTDSIEPALQRQWTRADQLIERARAALEG